MRETSVHAAVAGQLVRQLNQELSASYGYDAISLWCEDRHLSGFARYFRKQSAEERAHARKLIDHLLDRGVLPPLAALAAPRVEFASVMDVATRAQAMERENTAGIHAAYDVAIREKDYPAQVLLQWFVAEQVEEEAWTAELVARVRRAECPGGLAELDRHIERHLAKGEASGE